VSRGVILAVKVGLGKTIEAGLVISRHRAERRRKVLITAPANLRKQWHQELQTHCNAMCLKILTQLSTLRAENSETSQRD